MKRGILFVVSGPSGVGKGTVMKEVFKLTTGLYFSVSATTRQPRVGEKNGVNYHYITEEEFDRMVLNGEMLEYIEKFTNRYGTPKHAVEKILNEGKDVILEIETIGAKNVKELMPECIRIFILPPSLSELKSRLSGRKTETKQQEELRFNTSFEEINCAYDFDYVVVNNEVEKCAKEIVNIIIAERCKTSRNKDIIDNILKN